MREINNQHHVTKDDLEQFYFGTGTQLESWLHSTYFGKRYVVVAAHEQLVKCSAIV